MNTINPLSSATNLGSATSRSGTQSHPQKYLQSGEIFKAVILEATAKDLFVLDIGGSHITAQSKVPLSPGQSIQLQVMSTSPQVELKIVSNTLQQYLGHSLTLIGENIDLGGLLKTLQQTASPSMTVEKGVVSKLQGDGTYVIDIKGNNVHAQSNAELTPGQKLDLQVVATSPQIKMTIAPDPLQSTNGGTVTLIGDPTEFTWLSQILPQTPTALENLTLSTRAVLENYVFLQQNPIAGKQDGATLKNLVDGMGLSFEKFLVEGKSEKASATLKSALLEVAHVFKDAQEISNAAHRLLGTIEVYQLAHLQQDHVAQLIFPLPLPFLKHGYLTIEDYQQSQNKNNEGVQQPRRFALHLTLEELGNLRIDFLHYQDGLYIRFNTDSKEKSHFVESYSTDLKDSLSDIPLLGLTFSEKAQDPVAELIQKLIPQGSSMLDTKV